MNFSKPHKKYLLTSIFLLVSVFVFSQEGCNAIKYKQQNIDRLAPGFNYKHTFEIKPTLLKNGEMEFNYILNRGTLYMMNMSNSSGEEKNYIIELYNQDGILVGTNYDKRTDRFWPIGYACNQSGVHKIKVRLKDTSKACGIIVLGLRK